MEQPRNIEIFNRVVILTLAKLYESFPTPIDLDVENIGHDAIHDARDEQEAFVVITAVSSCSISFLAEEGFIRYEPSLRTLVGSPFPSARLTLKGFTVLGSIPSTVNETVDHRPFADQLREAVNEGANDSISELVKSMFLGAVHLGMSAAVGN